MLGTSASRTHPTLYEKDELTGADNTRSKDSESIMSSKSGYKLQVQPQRQAKPAACKGHGTVPMP